MCYGEEMIGQEIRFALQPKLIVCLWTHLLNSKAQCPYLKNGNHENFVQPRGRLQEQNGNSVYENGAKGWEHERIIICIYFLLPL